VRLGYVDLLATGVVREQIEDPERAAAGLEDVLSFPPTDDSQQFRSALA